MPRQVDRLLGRLRLRSLKARLVLVFLALALATTVVFVAGTREAFSTGWRALARPLVADYLDRLAAEIGSPPDPQRALAITQRLPLTVAIDGPQVQWRSHPERRGGGPGRRWAGADGAEPEAGSGDGAAPATQGREPPWRDRRTTDGHRIRFGIALGHRLPAGWDGAAPWIGWGTLAALLVLTGAAWLWVRRLLAPLAAIQAGAQRYGAGDFSRTIAPPPPAGAPRRPDELGALAQQVDAMAAGLKHMLDGQRGLLLAISHELRSPLTRARLHAELLDEGASRDALLRDLGQMRLLIDSLLEGERLAGGGAALQRSPVDLNALVRRLVAAEFQAQPPTLQLDPALPPLQADAVRLELLLRNLLDNARRHGGGTPVQLETALADGGVQIRIRDQGPGVDPAQLQRLGEAFFRPDAARTRATGGVGLGLHLCRRVVASHGGRIAWQNSQPGLQVEVWLPLQP